MAKKPASSNASHKNSPKSFMHNSGKKVSGGSKKGC